MTTSGGACRSWSSSLDTDEYVMTGNENADCTGRRSHSRNNLWPAISATKAFALAPSSAPCSAALVRFHWSPTPAPSGTWWRWPKARRPTGRLMRKPMGTFTYGRALRLLSVDEQLTPYPRDMTTTLRDDHLAAATVLDGDAAQRQRPALDRSDVAGARDPDNDGLPHPKTLNLICLKI